MGWNTETTLAYARWLVRWPKAVLFVVLLVSAIAIAGTGSLRFSTNYRMFFAKENPQRRAFDEIQTIYTKNDNIIIVLKPAAGSVFTPDVLKVVKELTDKAWQVPYAMRVDSITNFQYTHASGDDLVVEDLVGDTGTLTAGDLARIRSIAVAEPLLVNRLISPDGATTGVNITVHLPEKSESETPEAMAYARRLAADVRAARPDIEVALTGVTALSNAFREASVDDMATLVPVMFVVIFVAMFAFLRSWSATLVVMTVVTLASACAMGLAGWLRIQLSPPTVSAPTIIATLAVADCIHLLIAMLREMRKGLGKNAAIIESMRINMEPVFLTSVTTVIGFLSLNFSDAPPFRALGNITAMGVAAAWVYAIVLLPAMMALLPVPARGRATFGGINMERLADFVIRRRRELLWGMAGLALALAAFIPRMELNEQFVQYFGERIEFRRDTDFTTKHLTGIYHIDYSLEAGGSGEINEPNYLEHVEAFAEWFRGRPGVIHVATITDVMKRLNKNMHGDDPAWYKLPDNRELAAQYLLLYEMSLPYGLDLNDQINVDKSATRFTVTTESLSTREFGALKERAEAWLETNTPPAMHAEGTGPSVIFTYLIYRNARRMFWGTLYALLLICACLVLALRSVKLGLISMVPNMVPPLMAFGVWALLVGRVGLAASLVTSVALGIIVDDTVHFLSKYQRAIKEHHLDATAAVRYAFSTVGSAIWITTAILTAGFGVLGFSAFEMNSVQGKLTAMTIVAALVADFLLLPALLMTVERRSKDANASCPAHAA